MAIDLLMITGNLAGKRGVGHAHRSDIDFPYEAPHDELYRLLQSDGTTARHHSSTR